MNFGDIEAIKQIEKSNIDPRAALVQMAGNKVLQDYHGGLMVPLVLTMAGAGYAFSVMASPPLAIAAALLGGWHMWDKIQRGERAFDDIENGRIEKYLNEAQRKVLAQLPPVEDASLLATASTPSPHAVDVVAVAVEPGSIAAPPVSKDWTPQQWALWNRFTQDCPDLRYALMCKLLVVSGPQQTGKSSLASAIAYLRSYLLQRPTIAVTPHIDGAKIFDGEVIGAGGDFEAIQQFYTDLKENFQMGGDRRSLVVDELTQYTGDWEKLGQSIVRTALSESDKHGWSPVLINHASTVSAGFADIKGVAKLIENSAVQIIRQYDETPWGEQTRSAEVRLLRPGKPEVVVTIPDWLHLPILQQEYPMEAIAPSAPTGATTPATVPTATAEAPQQVAPPSQFLSPRESHHLQQQATPVNPFQLTPEILEKLYQLDAPELESATEPEDDGADLDAAMLEGLSKALKALVIFAHKKGDWIRASDVRTGVRMYRNTQITSEDIRDDFRSLAANGIGLVDGEGESLRYRF